MPKKATKPTRKADQPRRIVECALARAAQAGWAGLTLTDIADEAGLSLADLLVHFRSKGAILEALTRSIDDRMVAGIDPEMADQPARDRLFELLMRRFDALAPYRDGVRAIARDLPRNPLNAACCGAMLLRSMGLTLEAAGISAGGVVGLVCAEGLGAIYLSAMRVWLREDDIDRTMAALDRQLDRADRLMGTLCRVRGRGRDSEPAPAPSR
jgi:AcrR family transcriptional regulator